MSKFPVLPDHMSCELKNSEQTLQAVRPADSFQQSTTTAAVTATATVAMPHQRHGHTCFVWDPRNAALANGGALRSARGGEGVAESSVSGAATRATGRDKEVNQY